MQQTNFTGISFTPTSAVDAGSPIQIGPTAELALMNAAEDDLIVITVGFSFEATHTGADTTWSLTLDVPGNTMTLRATTTPEGTDEANYLQIVLPLSTGPIFASGMKVAFVDATVETQVTGDLNGSAVGDAALTLTVDQTEYNFQLLTFTITRVRKGLT